MKQGHQEAVKLRLSSWGIYLGFAFPFIIWAVGFCFEKYKQAIPKITRDDLINFKTKYPEKHRGLIIGQLVKNQPEDINIGLIALVLAREFYPKLDVEKFDKILDSMVADIKKLTNGNTDPAYRIKVLNQYFYGIMKFQYDFADLKNEKPENRFIIGLLEKQKGSCLTMPTLYIALAQRLGYPVYAVPAPRHLFARYVDSNLKEQNIETTSRGDYHPDDEYLYVHPVPKNILEKGIYFKTLTHAEFASILIAENASQLLKFGLQGLATDYLNMAIEINPKDPGFHRNLSMIYYAMATGGAVGNPYSVVDPINGFGFNRHSKGFELYNALAKKEYDLAYEKGLVWFETSEHYAKETSDRLIEYRKQKNRAPASGPINMGAVL